MYNMMTEKELNQLVIEYFKKLGYYHLEPEKQEAERNGDLSQVILYKRLRYAIETINPTIPEEAREQALKSIINFPSQNLIDNNEYFHKMLQDGIEVEYKKDDSIRGDKVWLIDYEDFRNNEFLVCDEFTVIENNKNRRPDIVLFINGLPLVVIELKNPADEKTTIEKAFTQLQNYKQAIPILFHYNSILVASDGFNTKAGTISSDLQRFSAWKSVDGVRENSKTTPQIETLIKGMLNKDALLDIIKQFIVFEKSSKTDKDTGQITYSSVKKIASYHQYYAVNKAVEKTKEAIGETGGRKVGVIWHTQGSGKSLSMLFYTGKLVIEEAMGNPTIVVIADRNDLDDQLFDTFAACKQLLRQDPVQAKSREELKELLKTAGGGIVFSTIQKFNPEEGSSNFECLSERKNIIVIADEAHRSQYGFSAKITHDKDDKPLIGYGYAKYLRDALPNASFIGFTGTPIEKKDASTRAVFGDYIDIYDIIQSEEDGSTVKIYYESKLAKLHLKEEERAIIDEEVDSITENDEYSLREKAKAKWAHLEAIVGHPNRLPVVAADLLEHFAKRNEALYGKGMIVCMSRRVAVNLYSEIIKHHPEWHNEDIHQGEIKVVMTTSSSDPEGYQIHSTTKQDRKEIAERFKNPDDPLKLVIVRDMWLTGFDVPCLHTMYIDKPMRGHSLMQAIARVNRVFKDKPGGLIVDYIGIASDLKEAISNYTESGGQGDPITNVEEVLPTMLEKYEIVEQMYDGYEYKKFFTSNPLEKMTVILEASEYILGLDDGKNRYIKNVDLLSTAFALCITHPDAREIRDNVGFFQAVKARLVKFEPTDDIKYKTDIETAVKQIVDRVIVAEEVVNIFDAAGIKKPDISILSDEFLEEVKDMKKKNIAIELLKKLLNDEIKKRSRKNLMQSRKLSEMLDNTIKKYQNRLLTTADIILELIELAKEIREADKRGQSLGLKENELAFYDALADNESARQVLGDETLRDLARILVKKVKENTSIDWMIKESARAKLRVIVKRTLKHYGYPPDQQLMATENVIRQAEIMAEEEKE